MIIALLVDFYKSLSTCCWCGYGRGYFRHSSDDHASISAETLSYQTFRKVSCLALLGFKRVIISFTFSHSVYTDVR